MRVTQSPLPFFPPPPADLAPPRLVVGQMIDGATSTLRVARGLLEGGRRVDLEGLDRVIGVLCARALDLPPDEGRAVRPRLALLLADLDALSLALQSGLAQQSD